MPRLRRMVNGTIRFLLGIVCKIDARDLEKIPLKGPLILYSNHTGSIEVPLVYVLLQPRNLIGLAKIETWDNAFLGWLFDLWGAIPLRRGEADMEAVRKALECLEAGQILGISPEGTRNKTGRLLRGHPGIVTLAMHSKATLMPVAHWGGEKFKSNIKRLRRTEFFVRVGEPMQINIEGNRLDKDARQKITDELMYKLAEIMPDDYRGEYADLSKATRMYVKGI